MVRFKNRWFLVEFITLSDAERAPAPYLPASFDAKHVHASLRQSLITNFGDAGWGAVGASLIVKYFSPATRMCIIRVARDEHRIAWGGLTLLTNINGVRVVPRVVHVSGTIKHVQVAAMRHNREVVARFRALAGRPDQYQAKDSYEAYLEKSRREIEALRD